MAVEPGSYFNSLQNYLLADYQVTKRDSGRIILQDNVYWPGADKPRKQRVRMHFRGEVLVVNLDLKNNRGNSNPLFHFLKNESKPWARRCDFVVFQRVGNQMNIYCIEFKSGSLPESLVQQMDASEAWCRSIHGIIKAYTGKARRLNLRKYVFSCMEDPERYCDPNGFLNRDHSIRHFHYDDLKTMTLDDLTNPSVELIS